jgi:3,4-dihydroxy 2-butanone 4-phosphate synthase/GTP cyclohydrolase II
VSTGISARDRAITIQTAIADDARPEDLVSPGRVFPLRARRGGVLVRTGQTEGSVDLARLAGLKAAGVICEIMRDDGEMARLPELLEFGRAHGLHTLSVADIIAWRLQRERIVRRRETAALRPGFLGPGEPFTAHVYDTEVEDTEYLALVRGDVTTGDVLVRVQSFDPVGDPFALRADVQAAIRAIDEAGQGVYLYVYNRARTTLLRSFERVLGQRTAAPPAPAAPTSDALRDFGLGAQVLADLGLHRIRLMSHLDRRIPGIEGFGIEVVERVSIPPGARRAGHSSATS